MIVLDSDASK